MSEIKVNKITPKTNCGTTTLGDSGDTFTIPSGVTISNLGNASGFGGTGEISWDTTVKTTGTFTPTAGVGYFLNTTGGTITVNLPAGVAGSSVAFADYAGTWQTSNVTISPNGTEKIGGTNSDVTLNTEGQAVQFVYIDGTQGWVNVIDSTSNIRGAAYIVATGGCITTCGNCKVHTFLSPGTFAVTNAAVCAADNLVSYAVVAGGGGGGYCAGGGGGAGGFRELVSPTAPYSASPLDGYPSAPNRITVSATPYSITVGGGGPGKTSPGAVSDGNDSTFSTITSTGGGGGGSRPSTKDGADGGSGGGDSADVGVNPAGGAGNTPPTTPAQGFAGGGRVSPTHNCGGMGGGGATVAGESSQGAFSPSVQAPDGGAGATTSISFSPVGYAGGGGGGGYTNCGTATGGTATQGGGNGSSSSPALAGQNGSDNTGGGGGGGGNSSTPLSCGGNGGSGVVIIRYKYQ